eukprot:6435993-Amphidinium_carterae.1
MCRELAMYLDIHLHAVLGDHHVDVPIAMGHTTRRGRNIPRSIRLLRGSRGQGMQAELDSLRERGAKAQTEDRRRSA